MFVILLLETPCLFGRLLTLTSAPSSRGPRHARRLPPSRRLLPLQSLHERRHPHGREPAGEAGPAAGRGRPLPGEERGEAEEGRPHPHPRENLRPEDGGVGQAQGRHVQRSVLQLPQAVVLSDTNHLYLTWKLCQLFQFTRIWRCHRDLISVGSRTCSF